MSRRRALRSAFALRVLCGLVAALLFAAAPLGAAADEISVGADEVEPQFRGYSVSDIEPVFDLVDHAGDRATMENYRGEWAVLFFGYSNCTDACPWIFGVVAQAVDLMESTAPIRPLFVDFSADPKNPFPLADLAEAVHPRMVGLAGTRRELFLAGRNWKMRRMQRSPRAGEVGRQWHHTTRLYLLTPKGEVAMLIDGTAKPEQVAGAMAIAVARAEGRYPPN